MQTILVTGSNGLLGQTLTTRLKHAENVKLIASSKGANRYPNSGGLTYVDLDITNKSQLEAAVSLHQPQVIIHTAAMTNVDQCHENKALCWQLNVEAVRSLIHVCERMNIHLVHLSTDFVFDGKNGPYTEQDKPNPISIYGESKLAAEELVQQSSCKWSIIRTILVYGVTPNMSRTNIVLWAKSALEKGEPIRVVNDQWRMPTLVDDLAEACFAVAQRSASGIFHISGPEMMTIYDVVLKVADFWNLDKSLIQPVSSASLNQEAKRPLKTGFVLEKAIQEIDYKPRSFEWGLQQVANVLASI